MTAAQHQAQRTPKLVGMIGDRHGATAPGLGGAETMEAHKVSIPDGGWVSRLF